MNNERPIILAAGGTGGHVFVALATAAAFAPRRVLYATDKRGAHYLGNVPTADIITLPSGSPSGHPFKALLGILRLIQGTLQAYRLWRRLRPAAVVGFGGYASAPPIIAARWLGIPTAIHQSDSVVGKANHFLARFADLLLLGFGNTQNIPAKVATAVVGIPVRADIITAAVTPPHDDGMLKLLVVGGSLGAKIFADVVPAALALLPPPLQQRLQVVQQCRADDLPRVREAYRFLPNPPRLESFFTDLPKHLAWCDLFIGRSGASTVAELATVGRASILVPLMIHRDKHQYHNAKRLETLGASWLLPAADFSPALLAERLTIFLQQPAYLTHARTQLTSLSMADAATALAQAVLALIAKSAHK